MKSRRRKRAVRRAAHINAAPADGGTNSESAAPLAGDASVVLARGLFLTTGGPHDPAVSRVPSPAPAARDRAKRREPEHQHGTDGETERASAFSRSSAPWPSDAVIFSQYLLSPLYTRTRTTRAHTPRVYLASPRARSSKVGGQHAHTARMCAPWPAAPLGRACPSAHGHIHSPHHKRALISLPTDAVPSPSLTRRQNSSRSCGLCSNSPR